MIEAVMESGFLFLAIPLSYPAGDPATGRDREGRLFILRPPEQYGHLLSRLGFDLVFRRDYPVAHGRSGVVWTNMVFRVRGGLRNIKLSPGFFMRYTGIGSQSCLLW